MEISPHKHKSTSSDVDAKFGSVTILYIMRCPQCSSAFPPSLNKYGHLVANSDTQQITKRSLLSEIWDKASL